MGNTKISKRQIRKREYGKHSWICDDG